MKTFLKVLLIMIALVVAVKLLPAVFVLVCLAAAGIALVAVSGLSILAGILCAALVVAALLSPIWLPVLAIVGLVALCRSGRARA